MTKLQHLVAAECVRLADFLDTLPASQWNAMSLCEKWRVREVIAHLTMPARYTPERFATEIADSGGDFTVMSDRVAARDGSLPVETLIAGLRSEAMQTFAPPGGGYEGALNHVVIHGLDVTMALGVARVATDDAVRSVLDQLAWHGGAANFGRDLSDVRLVATDFDWSVGTGRSMIGPAADLALFICNRKVQLADHAHHGG